MIIIIVIDYDWTLINIGKTKFFDSSPTVYRQLNKLNICIFKI